MRHNIYDDKAVPCFNVYNPYFRNANWADLTLRSTTVVFYLQVSFGMFYYHFWLVLNIIGHIVFEITAC